MKNLLLTLLMFMSGLAYSQNIIIDTLSPCQGATVTLTQIVPINIDCDSIAGAHLFYIDLPDNSADSIQTWWSINLTNPNIIIEPISFMFAPFAFPQSGCYGFEVVLDCSAGTGNVTILSSTRYISTVGIDELTLDRKVVKTTDIMGRECLPEPNKLLIYHYSDGTTGKIIKN
jgi:hypothetical protein